MTRLCVAACVILSALYCSAYPDGAPVGVCDTLVPKHGTFKPQAGRAPYYITVNPDAIARGKNVPVTITGETHADQFKGFVLQAHRSGTNRVVNGHFHGTDQTKTLDCTSAGSKNTATHANNKEKAAITIYWEAPENYTGKIVFRAAVVKNGAVFWKDILSNPLNVV